MSAAPSGRLSPSTIALLVLPPLFWAGNAVVGRLMNDTQLYDRLNSMASRVDQLMARLGEGQGTAGQLLQDRQLYDNMNRAVAELQSLLADIRKDPKRYLRVNVSIF